MGNKGWSAETPFDTTSSTCISKPEVDGAPSAESSSSPKLSPQKNPQPPEEQYRARRFVCGNTHNADLCWAGVEIGNFVDPIGSISLIDQASGGNTGRSDGQVIGMCPFPGFGTDGEYRVAACESYTKYTRGSRSRCRRDIHVVNVNQTEGHFEMPIDCWLEGPDTGASTRLLVHDGSLFCGYDGGMFRYGVEEIEEYSRDGGDKPQKAFVENMSSGSVFSLNPLPSSRDHLIAGIVHQCLGIVDVARMSFVERFSGIVPTGQSVALCDLNESDFGLVAFAHSCVRRTRNHHLKGISLRTGEVTHSTTEALPWRGSVIYVPNKRMLVSMVYPGVVQVRDPRASLDRLVVPELQLYSTNQNYCEPPCWFGAGTSMFLSCGARKMSLWSIKSNEVVLVKSLRCQGARRGSMTLSRCCLMCEEEWTRSSQSDEVLLNEELDLRLSFLAKTFELFGVAKLVTIQLVSSGRIFVTRSLLPLS